MGTEMRLQGLGLCRDAHHRDAAVLLVDDGIPATIMRLPLCYALCVGRIRKWSLSTSGASGGHFLRALPPFPAWLHSSNNPCLLLMPVYSMAC